MTNPRPRGRPRKDPERLARWSAPPGWSRLVAWVSPEEKKALKHVAIEANVSVADLVRALAGGLAAGVVALLVGTLTIFYGDRTMMGEIRDRGRARRRGSAPT